MFQSDFVGVAAVYIYVAVLIVFTEKVFSKRYPVQSRKFLHIMTGNIAFILPLFETREIMAFVAAGPFILFTFLMSPYSPIKSMRGKTSEAGMGWGWCTMRSRGRCSRMHFLIIGKSLRWGSLRCRMVMVLRR